MYVLYLFEKSDCFYVRHKLLYFELQSINSCYIIYRFYVTFMQTVKFGATEPDLFALLSPWIFFFSFFFSDGAIRHQ